MSGSVGEPSPRGGGLASTWKDVRKQLLGPHGSWTPITADGIELINLSRTPAITRYHYRGDTIPSPWPQA